MIESSSAFIKSSIPLYHNALKSIVFKCAELLMGIFIFKLFSLIAARSNQFTSYLMFTEDYIQRTLYISSRGLSRAGLFVLLFTLLNTASSFYGTLLWALDSPGYIFRATNATVADYQHQRIENPPYIIQLALDSVHLQDVEKQLPQTIGADLFNPGLNYTLTGEVSNSHAPEVVVPAQTGLGVGARIWLDDDGLSISPDTLAMWPNGQKADGYEFPVKCIVFYGGSALWNCTFSNIFAQDIMKQTTGKPEVQWSNATRLDSRYIMPNRVDNIWTSLGAGGGSAFMSQVFTLTKEKRRHTFFQSTLKATMLTNPGFPFERDQITDLVQRTWSSNVTERGSPLIGRIVDGMMNAQNQNVSYQFGANQADNNNKTVIQSNWGLYSPESNGRVLYSLITITTTNITLIRSETLAKAPNPFEICENKNFQNEAFGGKVIQTDCSGEKDTRDPHFYGQVDTAAVLITRGLGATRSNISAESLNDDVMNWLYHNSSMIASLLTARAYSVSVDPSLVQISVDKLMVAMSPLQLYLSCFALFLAILVWLCLMVFADAHWSNTLLSNLIHTTSEPMRAKPGYIKQSPNVTLVSADLKKHLAVDGKAVLVSDPTAAPTESLTEHPREMKGYMEAAAYNVAYNDPNARRQALLSGHEQNIRDG
ncbi:hypothetical protein F53441_668 [Fusarium austroafricanum]|uniref:Uncharacterized protein n=1 Tax=Fusarium austroafricanum TaxID=2364996 RepID=A0A8H4P349_9HYPO|nr:hypothetical protein F53441_668 [Fusarium austroafricanum]